MKALLFAFLSCCLCTRIERKVGDQPPVGKCTTFKWGGKTNLHWYACCHNCDEDPNPCDSKTYQSASSEDYCDECGKDNAKGDGTKGNTYACGGCVEQDKIMDKCTNKLRDIPGFCWSFIKCFEKKCKALTSNGEAGADDTPDTCFNLKCETGETVDNCPIDCCGEENPVCRPESGKCPPLCCSEPSCCSNSSECEENPAACSECEIKRCESLQKKPGSCTVIGTITSVTIVKQISKSACIAGVTYIYSENTVYLFLGCRAKMYICHTPCQHYSTTLRCESWGFQPASCGVGGTILKVAVAKKRSKSACVLGSSYNFSGNTLFVDGGCRADFSICYLPSNVKKISKRTDYKPYSKVYDNERSAAGSDVICAFLQFYTGIKLQHLKVLDAGGGTGTITKALIEHGVGNVSLVDASTDMLEIAKEKLADDIKSGTVSSIIHHNIPPLPFPDASFDAVMFNMFIYTDETRDHPEHVQTLKEAQRVLKPGGVVLVSMVERSTGGNMWSAKIDQALGERYVLRLPSLQCFDKMFYESGLSCTQKVSLLGSDIWPNYFKDPSSYINNIFLNFLTATHDERQRVNEVIEVLKQKGELQQWIAEHDKTTGLITVFVCRANADCHSYIV